jgi:hypothetical protein
VKVRTLSQLPAPAHPRTGRHPPNLRSDAALMTGSNCELTGQHAWASDEVPPRSSRWMQSVLSTESAATDGRITAIYGPFFRGTRPFGATEERRVRLTNG